jgi:hypothetical protein
MNSSLSCGRRDWPVGNLLFARQIWRNLPRDLLRLFLPILQLLSGA